MSDPSPLERLIKKLERRQRLSDDDKAAVLALPHVLRTYQPNGYVVREGEPPKTYCTLVLSGFAFRHKLTTQGSRQIVSLHLAGDLLDLQHLFLNHADHNVQALTKMDAAEINRAALQDIVLERPAVGKALWIDGLVEASIYREWVLNVGRRDARSRVAHVLCEFALRMEAAGLAERGSYELPLTQEQLGDVTGLTSVHVNRTLKSLAADGLVRRDRRYLSFSDWERLSQVGDFSSLYLHLEQTGA